MGRAPLSQRAFVAACLCAGLGLLAGVAGAQPPVRLKARIIATHPHDRDCYTQGLLMRDGRMFESCGIYQKSRLREVDPASGRVLREVALEPEYFAEGLELVNGRLYLLTWRENIVFVHDAETFEQVDQYQFEGEGWGLAWDGRHLLMSNGTADITFRDPETFAPVRTLTVRANGQPVPWLNELEFIDGFLYANVYRSEMLVRIDPRDGAVVAVIDASNLLVPMERTGVDVLNGIAHNSETGAIYLTGKLWPKLLEVEFIDPATTPPPPPQTTATDTPTTPVEPEAK